MFEQMVVSFILMKMDSIKFIYLESLTDMSPIWEMGTLILGWGSKWQYR